jgi:hypothetical protein
VAAPDPTYLTEYAPVAERVRLFYERYPSGRIVTELVRKTTREVVFRAAVYRDVGEPDPAATGWACEREGDGDVNTVACLENTETSAVGRALANLGFLAGRARPSAEEMAKAARARARMGSVAPAGRPVASGAGHAAGHAVGHAVAPAVRHAVGPGTVAASPPRPHLFADFDRLIEQARHVGLRPARAARWRARLLAPERPWSGEELLRAERWLRAWVRRQRETNR